MRIALVTTLAFATALFGGCASMNSVDSEVSTYSQWPASRQPATFAFERLPSQQARAQAHSELEAAARPGLLSAGFQEVNDAKSADTVVQIDVRISRADHGFHDDPFWWRGGLYDSRFGRPYWGPGFGMMIDSPRYDREVAVLIRDRVTGQPLYEARAASDGLSAGNMQLMTAMFRAAMKDFPQSGVNPRRVSIPLGP